MQEYMPSLLSPPKTYIFEAAAAAACRCLHQETENFNERIEPTLFYL